MGTGLVSDCIDFHTATNEFRKHFSAVANESDRNCSALFACVFTNLKCLFQIQRHAIAVACANPALNSRRIDVDAKECRTVQRRCQGLSATHPTHPAGDHEPAAKVATKMAISHSGEGFKRAL